MKRFLRRDEPPFWSEKERLWKASNPRPNGKTALHDRQHQTRSLASWFHELVRMEADVELCAYCDGPLRETSTPTIDHFRPERIAPDFGLRWSNLLPACSYCNSTHKRDQWSDLLVSPEEDHVEDWFDFDPENGEVRPAPGLDTEAHDRVVESIRIYGLNQGQRPEARLRVMTELRNAAKAPPDELTLRDRVARGPYRFVGERFLASRL